MTENKKLIDINEVSQRLSIPKATIYGWRHREFIPANVMFKIGGKVMFDPLALDKWAETFRGVLNA